MADLVTLDQARKHLRLTGSYEDDDLQMKLTQAQAIVLDHVNQRRSDGDLWAAEIASWTEETVPRQVQAAILIQLGELYRYRGDDASDDNARRASGFLVPAVVSLLNRLRDPAVS